MKEVRSPKKPLTFYYLIILAALLLFHVFVMPSIAGKQAKEVDYGTFMSMIEKKNIGDVEIKDSEIVFTDKKESTIYKTGVMDDPTLTERLYESGAKFTKDIQQTTSPMLLSLFLPLVIFIGIGEYMRRKMMDGGKDSMAFGLGKSSTKVYVLGITTVSVLSGSMIHPICFLQKSALWAPSGALRCIKIWDEIRLKSPEKIAQLHYHSNLSQGNRYQDLCKYEFNEKNKFSNLTIDILSDCIYTIN